MTDLLHRIGFVYKKTKIVPGKADPEKQQEFLDNLEKLKESKKPEDKIYYLDGVHPQPYAPNLNLIERLWKFFKKKITYNRYYETFDEFKKSCMQFFTQANRNNFQDELDSLLTTRFHIVSA